MGANVGRTYSLVDISVELLADITFRVARSNVIDGASLGKVSLVFRRHWNTERVRRECPLGPLEFELAIGDNAEIKSLVVAMTQFCQDENPDALYREEITSYFGNRRTERADEGLSGLKTAAEKGHIKVWYLYDLILVCSDLERRDEGFDTLATLMKPSLLESVIEMTDVRNSLVLDLDLLREGIDKSKDMVVDYVSDCRSDKSTTGIIWTICLNGEQAQLDSMTPLMLRCVRNVFGTRETTMFFTAHKTYYLP